MSETQEPHTKKKDIQEQTIFKKQGPQIIHKDPDPKPKIQKQMRTN